MPLFGSRPPDPDADRIPPGQYRTDKFPVLHYGSVPSTDLSHWDFRVWGEVETPFSITWDEFKALKPDLQVMAFVTLFVPSGFLNIPTHGSIQYHPSLLPLHRGPSSIN